MYVLEGFWVGAIAVAGRVDFRALIERLGVPPAGGWSRHDVTGCASQVSIEWLGARPVQTDQPFLTVADPRYPERLRSAAFPPPVLFYEGNLGLLDEKLVAVVGSRAATATGLSIARRIGQTLIGGGAAVISGLARGIDTAAHEASLPRTVAVLGQGLGIAIHGQRGKLLERMAAGEGLVLSELLPTWGGSKFTFPQRNRIIAGLAEVTVVVEAGRRSGALITARWALDYGKEVFAVPGSPLQEQSAGCLDLIMEGASMARDGTEVLTALGLDARGPEREVILEGLGLYGADLPTLVSRTGMSSAAVAAELRALELTGRVRRLPGEYYLPVR
jgi:DNA processing protein